MANSFRLACVQVNAGNEIGPNVEAATNLIRQAALDGADFISLPECVALLEPDRDALFRKSAIESDHPALHAFQDLAAELGTWLHVGSLAVLSGTGRIANRTFLIDPGGVVTSKYDKIHMFDVDLEDGESYRESNTYQPGDAAVIADLPWGRAGLTICYDLRFPALYTDIANAGADFIGVPSAFTRKTGRAHWHVLLRARAIETGCWVFAAAQCGDHAAGRQTYGHSLIVDPWGEIVAEAGVEPGVIIAEIDPARVAEARKSVPSLANARTYSAAGEVRRAAE
jgi:deaminated glutathione amidase